MARMPVRFRDWLLARLKACTNAEAARARTRAAPIAEEMLARDFVSELERYSDSRYPRGMTDVARAELASARSANRGI